MTSSESRPFRVGLLGHGTVGSAFATLLQARAPPDRADHRPAPGAHGRPDPLAGDVRGDRRGLRPRRGGHRRPRARAGVRPAGDARRAARGDRQQAAALPARRGALGDRPRARRAAALRGGRRRRRAGHPRAAGVAGRRPRRARARHRQRDDELHPQRDGPDRRDLRVGPGRTPSGSATRRRTRPTTSPARTPPRRWRSSRGSRSTRRCTLDQVRFEGIEHITADDMEYARELGLGLKLIGTAERIDGGLSVRVHPAFLYNGHPLASVSGPFNAVTIESPDITEITMSGPGAGGPQTASAVLGDVISAMIPPASTPEPSQRLEIVEDVVSRVLPAPGGRRPARRPGAGRADPGDAGRVDQVGRPEGPRRERAPGHGRAPDPRVAPARRRRAHRPAWSSCAPRRARSGSSRKSSCR